MAGSILFVALGATACSGSTEDAANVTTTAAPTTSLPQVTATTTAPSVLASCLRSTPELARALGNAEAFVVQESVAKGPGIARTGEVWFIASPDGAIWVTVSDPTAEYDGGVILPLNDQARGKSDFGVGVPAGSPPFAGLTDASPGAVAALTCAGG